MSGERWRTRVDAWLHAWREWYPTVPIRLNDWAQQVRAEPTLFFRTPAVQAVGAALGVVVAVLVVNGLIHTMTPVPTNVLPPAQEAPFHLRCTNPDCGRTFIERLPIDFDRWPMRCPHCKQKTVYELRRCPKCRQWVIPRMIDKVRRCPKCNERL